CVSRRNKFCPDRGSPFLPMFCRERGLSGWGRVVLPGNREGVFSGKRFGREGRNTEGMPSSSWELPGERSCR
ncbi:MAG: hypothetical protein LOD92_05545, partial [Bacillales bacterium]